MADDTKSFFQTVPGVLTALATVLTAVTGLIIALNQVGPFQTAAQTTSVSGTATIAAPIPPPVSQGAVPAAIPVAPPAVGSNSEAGTYGRDALTGSWLNTFIDPRDGRPESQLVIRQRADGTLTLQGWGNCGGGECDWGLAPLDIATGDPKTNLIGLHATTKLIHDIPNSNRKMVSYLTLEGTGTPNILRVNMRWEAYTGGQFTARREEKPSTYTSQESSLKN